MAGVSPLNVFSAFLLGLAGNALIYSGLAFINAKLFPAPLSFLYGNTGIATRTLIMTLTFAALANYMISTIYRLVDPACAGMAILVSVILVVVAKTLILGEGTLDLRLALAVAALAGCAVWVNFELHRG
jgi:hypothetical protein